MATGKPVTDSGTRNVVLTNGIIDERLASKQDILDLRRDMKEMELRLKHDLTLRLGGMLAAAIAVIAALVKLL